MKSIAISFTSVLSAVYAGKLDVVEIDEFVVGCTAEHLPPPDASKLPYEISWCRSKDDKIIHHDYNEHLWDRTLFRPDQIEAYSRLWHRMSSVPVLHHDANQWDVAWYLVNQGHRVWIQHGWYVKEIFPAMGDIRPVILTPIQITKGG